MVTVQSRIAKGLFTATEFLNWFATFAQAAHQHGAEVQGPYVCPHRYAEPCACKKPNPILYEQAIADLGITRADSFVIGDSSDDMRAARRLGVRSCSEDCASFARALILLVRNSTQALASNRARSDRDHRAFFPRPVHYLMRTTSAAKIYVALTAVVIAFQLALAAGAPWGELTMGGAFPGRLPPTMRVAAVGSAVLLLALSAVVAARAGLALPRWRRASRRLIWVVVAYALVGVVLNAVTPSARERMVWLPVGLVLAGCALVVARSKDHGVSGSWCGGPAGRTARPRREFALRCGQPATGRCGAAHLERERSAGMRARPNRGPSKALRLPWPCRGLLLLPDSQSWWVSRHYSIWRAGA